MSIKDIGITLKSIWDRLGEVDCPDENLNNMPELEASLNRVKELESDFGEPSSTSNTASNKAGKGGKSGKVVETVVIDPKAMQEIADKIKEERVVKEEKTR